LSTYDFILLVVNKRLNRGASRDSIVKWLNHLNKVYEDNEDITDFIEYQKGKLM
jgi:hypothetical protein